jgi:hypothetical protein
MRDYTFNGIPVAKMRTEDIEDCLREGIQVNADDGLPNIRERILERLRLELLIRAMDFER